MGDNKAMSGCSDEGRLRAYLDDALPAYERVALGTHLRGCTACRSRLREVEALATQVGGLLPRAVSQPEPGVALAQLRATLARERSVPVIHTPKASRRRVPDNVTQRRGVMSLASRFWSGPRRPGGTRLFAGLTALVMVLGLMAFPPVRALAGQLLQVFRVQDVMFIPIDSARLQQLESMDFDPKTLFMAQPEVINNPAPPQPVASAAEAANAAGFTPSEVTSFPSTTQSSEIVVHDRRVVQTQVNVESARQLLEVMGVSD
ncbi:MAG TPA: zf-HC2 domain-containing protein, partial [Herpetosiphonaceae bacterium]|nr:zf-HC2 domain-containing protein [Herpetosiphonaceae bacterium]